MTNNKTDWDPMMARVEVYDTPIKLTGEATMSSTEVQQQADFARGSLMAVDYSNAHGTCVDERPRVGTLSGEATVEARPSVPGGPNVYGLYVLELSGAFGDHSAMTGEERLDQVTRDLNSKGIRSGGHVHCAANGSFGGIMGIIAGNKEAVSAYAQSQLGDAFDRTAMDEVFGHADEVVSSGRYADWGEPVLVRVLGDDAGRAIEQLAEVPHEARTLARNKITGMTVDQTHLHEAAGQDTFVQDDPYADYIEHALATGPDPERMAVVMRHAREAVLAGVANAVPNPELHQFDIV